MYFYFVYQGHALNVKIIPKPDPGRTLLVLFQQPPSLLTAIIFHLPAAYLFNKSTNFHFLQINQPLPM